MFSDEISTLIRSLQDPSAYAEPVTSVRMLQTHISWVFLTGPFAYKVKKPVNFGFIDCGTLQRRLFFCEEELRLNRRLAPDLYLDVLPITGTAEKPCVGGAGEPIEYCVKMRQFDQECLLSKVIAAGGLHRRHIDALARQVSEFHRRIPVAEASSRFGSPTTVAESIRANFVSLESAQSADPCHEEAFRKRLGRLRGWCEREIARSWDTFLMRKRGGFVRECHGDMHSGNMILVGENITIFDCIEFNEDLRWIDVSSEVAFCTMDLHHRGRGDLARRFLNGYLEWCGDYGGLAVFPLYFVYRGLVRAKVVRLQLEQTDLAPDQRDDLKRDLDDYLQLAESATDRPVPFLAITHGVSGSGKTSGTQAVIEHTGAIRVRSDLERKRLAGLAPFAESHSAVDSGIYSPQFSERTYDRLAALAVEILKAGFPAIVDATFLKRSHRDRFRALASSRQIPFVILDFPTDEATCRRRIRERARSETDASEATEDVLNHQLRSDEALHNDERPFAVSVETTQPDSIDRVLLEIDRRR